MPEELGRAKKNGTTIQEGRTSAVPIFRIQNCLSCRILERLNRFVVTVEVKGRCERAHINNTGRLQEFLIRGREAFCFKTPENRKTDFRLFAVKEKNMAALIDTQLQMKAFEKAFELGMIPWLKKFHLLRRNAKLGTSRIDYLFDCGRNHLYLEVKSVVLREEEFAMYPDCPSLRGQRHIEELIDWERRGGSSMVVFIAALPGVNAFKPNRSADSRVYELLVRAEGEGIDVKALGFFYNPRDSQIWLFSPNLKVVLNTL